MERRLAAILAADVAGYSRLMEIDEAGTLVALKALRKDLIDPAISEHHGRIVKLMGDGALVEFASVVDAVACAVAIQTGMAQRNNGVPQERRIDLRIGVHLGDVIVEDNDIYGDGVNVAARLEGLTEPGGLCVSDMVYQSVQTKLDLAFEDMGAQALKNIEKKVRIWKWVGKTARAPRGTTGGLSSFTVSGKPSIAVLPFENMSGDPEQVYFSDGITEDIITELSRFPELFVIARNSAFTYKGRAVRIQDVGKELGVQYVVEGSVRKSGNRLRVSAQLIEAESGNHVWADRFDRELVDVFDLQDELTQAIVSVLPGRLESFEARKIARKPPDNMAAYELLLAGKIHHHRLTKEDNAKALELLERATALDPSYAAALAWKACVLGQAIGRGYLPDPKALFDSAVAAVEKALSLDQNEVECHRLMTEISMETRQWGKAELHSERALSLNPNDPRLVAQKGELLTWLGEASEGAKSIRKAMRLDPYSSPTWAHLLGRALMLTANYAEAIEAYQKSSYPRFGYYADVAGCYGKLGMREEAKEQAAMALKMKPDFSVADYVTKLTYKNEQDRERHRQILLSAPLPT